MINLAIKFGSDEIIIYRKGMGIVSREASYVAMSKINRSRKIYAYGEDAVRLCIQKHDEYRLFQVIKGIEIVDKTFTKLLIERALNRCVFENGMIDALVAVPCALTEKKLLELKLILHDAGINKVTFVQNAVGIRFANIKSPENAHYMIVDAGKYLMDVSVLTKYQFCAGRNYLIGGAEMDNALVTYVQDNYNITITEQQAEMIKNEAGSLYNNDAYTINFEGLTEAGEYKEIVLRANEIRVAIVGVYDKMFDLIEEMLDSLSPEILAEVRKYGITFTGGVSSIPGLVEYANQRLKIPIMVADNPKDEVVLGVGKLLTLDKTEFPHIEL